MAIITSFSQLPTNIKGELFNYYTRNLDDSYLELGAGNPSFIRDADNWLKTSNGQYWLSQRGYAMSGGASGTTGGTTGGTSGGTSGGQTYNIPDLTEGTEYTVNGQKRFIVKDYYGHTYAETPTADGKAGSGNIDYVYDNGRWVLIRLKTNALTGETIPGSYTAVNEPTLTGKVWDQMSGWVDDTSTTETGTTTDPEADARARLYNAQADEILATLNNPTSSNEEKNAAAVQLYGIMASMTNNNNSNAVSQWGNQAGAFNTAYGNAIEQNKWLQDMSTSPLNTVAYLNLIRGQNPPDWNIPNYQQMPDAFTGWQQQIPVNQTVDPATVLNLMKELGIGGNQSGVGSNAANSQWNATANQYQTNYTAPAGTEQPPAGGILPNGQWVPSTYTGNVITPQNAPANWTDPNPPASVTQTGGTWYNGTLQPEGWTPPRTATTADTNNFNKILADIARMKQLAGK
jgi:hypothetical protein